MLVLTRRNDEWFIVYQDGKEILRFTPFEMSRGKGRFGFVADKNIRILRAELVEEEKTKQGE